MIALRLGSWLLFLRVSMLHQTLVYLLKVNLRLLYLVGVPALLGLVVAGGFQRSFRGKPTWFWTGFALWMTLAIPFSSWKGGSLPLVLDYFRTDLVMIFIAGGLAITWRDCNLLMRAIAAGAVIDLVTSRLFSDSSELAYRVGIQFGTVSNANDFAGHLAFALPFLLWAGLAAKNFALRACALAGVAYGAYVILKTGSRGGLVALAVTVLFFLWRATMRQRLVFAVALPIVFAAFLVVVSRDTWKHLLTFSADSADAMPEAVASSQQRMYLLKQSLIYTSEHPLFGVGPGQFASFEGQNNWLPGLTHGSWHDAHNSFTQAASECGIPGGILYVAGIVSTFWLLNSTYRRARRRTDCQDIRTATFCIMLALIGYCTATLFLNFAYFFYLPAIGGLTVAVTEAAKKEFLTRRGSAP